MSNPYRDQHLECPACQSGLRAFETRLVCDSCTGLYLERDDLIAAIRDLTGIDPELVFFGDKPGKRTCPRCETAMTACRLRIAFPIIQKDPKTRPKLDRCEAHGIWFDSGELVRVFETVRKVASAGPRGGGSGGLPVRTPGNGMGWGFGEG